MHKLCNALKSGECQWKRFTVPEEQPYVDEIKVCHTNGEVVRKWRKKRSNVGVKCKCVDYSSDKENERVQSKKQKVIDEGKDDFSKKATVKKLQAPTGHKYISDSQIDEYSTKIGLIHILIDDVLLVKFCPKALKVVCLDIWENLVPRYCRYA